MTASLGGRYDPYPVKRRQRRQQNVRFFVLKYTRVYCIVIFTGPIKYVINPRTAKEGVDSTPLHDFLRKILQFFLVFLTLF